MKANILTQLMDIVSAKNLMDDFCTFVLPEIAQENDNTYFFLYVGKYYCEILQTHKREKREKLKDETMRYEFMRRPNAEWEGFLDFCSAERDGQIYFYDGLDLMPIDFNTAKNLVPKVWSVYIQEMQEWVRKNYPNEKYDRKVDIEFDDSANDIIWDVVECDLHETLTESIDKYFGFPRNVHNHKIVLFGDENNDFTFTEFVNDKPIESGKFVFKGKEWKVQELVD